MFRYWILIALLLTSCNIKNPIFHDCTVYPRLVDDRYNRSINSSNVSSQYGYIGTEGVLSCRY